MKLVKRICVNQKEITVIKSFLEFLEEMDDDCYDEFVQQVGCHQNFYTDLNDFLSNVDVDPWGN